MKTFADRINKFNKTLEFNGTLPDGIKLMNPFKENPAILDISGKFYNKYYSDNNKRYLILGINPGRFGAGATGIPFTDTKRLREFCGISIMDLHTHELSSVFVYDVIKSYGSVKRFYSKYFISSICPLGFVKKGKNNKFVNYNYYDSKELTSAVYDFIADSVKKMVSLGANTDKCFIMGMGKNYNFMMKLNKEFKFFDEVIPLEHPRFIMQYRLKKADEYVNKYLKLLK